MRFQPARPLFLFQGVDIGFRPLRRRRRGRREPRRPRRVGPAVQSEAELVPVAADPRRHAPPDPSWGPLTRLGQQLRVQAKRGYRAAVVELQPGLYLVGEVPEASLRPEFGAVPMLAPLLTLAASRALRRRERRAEATVYEAPAVYEPPQRLPGPAVPARWVDAEDLETVAGCGCRRCGGGR